MSFDTLMPVARCHSLQQVVGRTSNETKNMKAQDLKSKIQFCSEEVSHNRVMITASVEVHAVMEYDKQAVAGIPTAIDDIKDRLREMIMRHIYDDQRAELYDALMDLFKASPMDYAAMDAARGRILDAAKRQRPSAPND